MEGEELVLQVFDLHNTKLLLTNDQPNQKLALQGEIAFNPDLSKSSPNLIDLTFTLSIY